LQFFIGVAAPHRNGRWRVRKIRSRRADRANAVRRERL
jgi:hypothetical protein